MAKEKNKFRNSEKSCETREQGKKYKKRKMDKMVNRKNKGRETDNTSYIGEL